jgi:hypothetical protein
MLSWLLRNRGKILILYALKVLLFIPHIALGAQTYTEIHPIIASNGDVTVTCPVSTYYLDTTYRNTYPATSTVVSQNSSLGSVCSGNLTGNLEGGFNNGAGSTPDDTYWVSLQDQVGTGNETFYYFRAVRSSGSWSSLSGVGTPVIDCSDPTTRIIDFSPEEATTTNNPVFFDISACVNPTDTGIIRSVSIRLHNIDQNVLLLSALSPNDIVLLNEMDADAGSFYFSTSTIIGEGNYRIEACIEHGFLNGYVLNLFSNFFNSTECQSHQFIVGTSTFIGNISQRLWGDTNTFINGLSATSSEALANTCNPINIHFDIRQCVMFMLIPSGGEFAQVFGDAKDSILTRWPWGYVTRTITILSSSATTSLPAFTAQVQIGPGDDLTPETMSFTFDMGDMITGGGQVLESVHDPFNNKTPHDVFYPMVQLTIALGVVMTILADLMKSHKNEDTSRQGKLS